MTQIQAAGVEQDWPDHSAFNGAQKLRKRLEDYWWERGYEVEIKLVSGGQLSGRTDIRSNLINGAPQGAIVHQPKLCHQCTEFNKRGFSIRCPRCDESPSKTLTEGENNGR